MEDAQQPAIVRLVAHHGGPTAVSKLLDGAVVYQEVQRWVRRGWASPMHLLRLQPLLLEGMTLQDLGDDRDKAARREAAGAQEAA